MGFANHGAPCIFGLDVHMHDMHIECMNLDQYLFQNGMTDAAFAVKVGHSQPHVNRVRRMVTTPSPELAKRIEAATDGAVTIADLYASIGPAPQEVQP
jgi:hypothetical protein